MIEKNKREEFILEINNIFLTVFAGAGAADAGKGFAAF
jgi:hypothetical protein